MKTLRIAASMALAVYLLAASGTAGYTLLCPNRSWSSTPIYIVDARGLASVLDGDGGATRVVHAITSNLAWNGAGAGTVIGAQKGNVASFSLGDGVPMLNFTDPLGMCRGSCLAATFTGFYRARPDGTYEIYDADIVTNTAYSWTSQGEDPNGAGCLNEFFVEGVMVHETGHALGLGHSSVAGATMYPSVRSCDNSGATIEPDDRTGMTDPNPPDPPCTGCEHYRQYLADGNVGVQPCGGSYSSPAGVHRGYLIGPEGVDFDLHLERWNGSEWVLVRISAGPTSSEDVTYDGPEGTYRWRIVSFLGTGTYHFWLDRP
ncbi:MAG TPA: matrixin family metalloprotease [Thermoanaerobaculia bacterium]|nr:matrixin family metalloprotease [Thermoanaerobaculia bacterium]